MILGILIAFILIPQVALASWWNPFSWFKKNTKTTLEQTVQVQEENPATTDKKRVVDNKVSGKKIVTPKINNIQEKSTKEVGASIASSPVSSPIITLPPPDLCKNVEGAQSSYIPKGMYREKDGNCYPKPIEIYFPESQQTIQNTNPVPAPAVSPVDTTPKEITQEEMMSGLIYSWANNDVHTLWIATDGAQKGDVVTLTFNGINETKTVTSISAKNSIWSGWSFENLDVTKEYPLSIRIERGNKFTISVGVVKN